MVALADRPEFQLAVKKNRFGDIDVRRVVIAVVRIIQDEHVTLVDVTGKGLGNTPDGKRQGAHQHRDVRGLCHQAQFLVEHGGDKVARLGEDGRARGAQHGLADLLADGIEPVADDGNPDRVDGAVFHFGVHKTHLNMLRSSVISLPTGYMR